jgi:transcription-repair coupling factor (superfamily II helicase)
MALNRVRDISIISTPPQDRLAVTTIVKEHDDQIIQEAILRETARGGQVYYLYNDVASIEKCLRIWQEKMPELRFAIAHGQMPKKELHQTMRAFYHHHVDVLIATTIIESGIDNPQANTLIIDRAEKLGLAQLHQIRGRVGRSHQQAYAYLLTPPSKLIEKTAQKRLHAIEACSGLGAGLELAHYDLDIRGGGAILGEAQSGQIQAIGYPLYISLLEKTIKALESGKQIAVETLLKQQKVQLETPFAAFIPDAFMHDIPQRLYWYKQIASANTIKALEATQAALEDQYGRLPQEAIQLINNQKIKIHAQARHIQAIKVYSDRIAIHFNTKENLAIEPLINCVSQQPRRYQMQPPAQIKIHHRVQEHRQINEILDQFYQDISA